MSTNVVVEADVHGRCAHTGYDACYNDRCHSVVGVYECGIESAMHGGCADAV